MRSFFSSPLRRLAVLGLLVLFTGCITIEENYTFKKDGSGTMEYVLDLSAMGEFLKSMEQMSDDKGGKDKKQGLNGMELTEKLDALKKIPGIKKVGLKKEEDGYIQRVSFAFQDINALNAALNTLMPDSTGAQKAFFNWDGNTLVRTNNLHAHDLGETMAKGDSSSTDSATVMGILQSMQYKYSFAFANDVSATEQVDGMVKEMPDSRKVKLSTDWSVIMRDPKALDLRITLNK